MTRRLPAPCRRSAYETPDRRRRALVGMSAGLAADSAVAPAVCRDLEHRTDPAAGHPVPRALRLRAILFKATPAMDDPRGGHAGVCWPSSYGRSEEEAASRSQRRLTALGARQAERTGRERSHRRVERQSSSRSPLRSPVRRRTRLRPTPRDEPSCRRISAAGSRSKRHSAPDAVSAHFEAGVADAPEGIRSQRTMFCHRGT